MPRRVDVVLDGGLEARDLALRRWWTKTNFSATSTLWDTVLLAAKGREGEGSDFATTFGIAEGAITIRWARFLGDAMRGKATTLCDFLDEGIIAVCESDSRTKAITTQERLLQQLRVLHKSVVS